MTWLISDEARKHRAFREVWVACILGGLYLLLGLYTEISEQNELECKSEVPYVIYSGKRTAVDTPQNAF